MKKPGLFKKFIRLFILVLAAIWMLFEDWVWDSIVALMEMAGRLKAVHRVERFLARQSPYVLLTMFCVPFLIMIPAKLYGLFLITSGKVVRGVTIFVMAKALITALVTRLFVISKDKLLQITWFAAFYGWFMEKKEWLYAEVRQLPGWQTAKKWIGEVKARFHALRKKR